MRLLLCSANLGNTVATVNPCVHRPLLLRVQLQKVEEGPYKVAKKDPEPYSEIGLRHGRGEGFSQYLPRHKGAILPNRQHGGHFE